MEPVTALLGYAVGKAVFKAWFKDSEFLASATESTIDIIQKVVGDRRARSAAERQLARVSERATDLMEPLIEYEWRDLPSYEKNAAVRAVKDAVDSLNINSRFLSSRDYDAEKIVRSIKEACDLSHLNSDAQELAGALASEVGQLILDLSASMPEFHRDSYAEVLKRESEIINRFDRVFDEIEKIRESTASESADVAFVRFEQTYRRSAARALDQIELFGLDASTRASSRQHNLSTAYISLSVSGASKGDDIDGDPRLEDHPDARAMFSMTAEEAASWSRLIVIKGEAGSGKTTLLQSLAVRSATASFSEEMKEWNDYIPFFIRLRALSGQELPAPEEFPKLVTPNIAGTMPVGWVHAQLSAGRAVLLIDGLDEISTGRRDKTRKWVADLLQEYPGCRVVITSRPPAIPDGWLAQKGFTELELLPMSPEDVSMFIDHWHEAVANEEHEPIRRESVRALVPALRERIRADRDLRELAATPLLCAMLCAMNRDRKQVLPTNRIALYEAAVQMVLHGRDEERKIRVDDLPKLDYETKKSILQEIAFWMMQNGVSMADTWRIEGFVETLLPIYTRLGEGVTASGVVASLIQRSGILRSPTEGKVDFIHNAFKEYLCAKSVSSADRFGYLGTVLSNEAWREVAALATAMADGRRREEFINRLLADGDCSPSRRARFHLLAVRCLETCTELDPQLQNEIRDRLSGLSPPSSITEAKALSAAGEMAIPLLKASPSHYARTAAACVRALRLIGTPEALDEIANFAPDERATVAKEVIAAWPFFDTNEFGAKVLAQSKGIYGWMRLNHSDQLQVVKYLKSIQSLSIQLRRQMIEDHYISHISHLTNLIRLALVADGSFDVGRVAGLRDLFSLSLHFPQLRGINEIGCFPHLERLTLSGSTPEPLILGALSENITELNLKGMDGAIESGSASFNRLQNLSLSEAQLISNPTWISEIHSLRSVDFASSRYRGELRLLEKSGQLSSLHMRGFSDIESLDELVSCKCLRKLYLFGVDSLTDISRLGEATSLITLAIRGAKNLVDLRPLVSAVSLRDLVLDVTEHTDLSPLDGLGSLRSLQLITSGGLNFQKIKEMIAGRDELRRVRIRVEMR